MPRASNGTTSGKLRRRLMMFAVGYIFIATLVIAAISFFPLFGILRQQEESSLLNTAKTRALAVEEYLGRVHDVSRQIAARTTIRSRLEEYAKGKLSKHELEEITTALLYDSLDQSDELVGITRLDTCGEIISQVGEPIPDRFHLVCDPTSNEMLFSDPKFVHKTLYLISTAPIMDHTGLRIGTDLLLFATRDLKNIIRGDRDQKRYVGYVLGRAQIEGLQNFPFGSMMQPEIITLEGAEMPQDGNLGDVVGKGTGLIRFRSHDSEPPYMAAFSSIQTTGWGLLVIVSERELYKKANQTLVSLSSTVLLLTLLSGMGLLLLLKPLAGKVLVYSGELENLNLDLQQRIEERQAVEKQLRRSELEWSETFEAITDAVSIMDLQGNLLKMNQGARVLLGMESSKKWENIPGRLFKAGKIPQESLFARMLKEKQPQFGENYLPEEDRYFQVSVYPLCNETGDLWGGVHIAKDITEEKRLARLKEDLISSVSHEMRTPLTAMLGFIEYLLENQVDRCEEKNYLEIVQKETNRLNDMISNFLDLQRLQAQMESYYFEAVSPCEMLDEAQELFAKASRKHKIIINCSHELPLVRGDRKKLLQVFKNLLSNAIKYSPDGGEIQLSASVSEEGVTFTVRDQGVGIPKDALDKIFARFYRVEDRAHRMPSGTGLGLALAWEIIKAHRGKIWAESAPKKGSTFFVRLPIMPTL